MRIRGLAKADKKAGRETKEGIIYTYVSEDRKKEGEATALNNIAEIYRKKREYNKALEYYQQALNLGKDDKNKATVYNNIAFGYTGRCLHIFGPRKDGGGCHQAGGAFT